MTAAGRDDETGPGGLSSRALDEDGGGPGGRPAPRWRMWLSRLRAAEAALSMTHDDIQDARIARLEAAVARLQADATARP